MSLEYRAGGTDLQERLRSGVATGPVEDLSRLPGLAGIAWDSQGRARIGALTSLELLARDAGLAACYPGLAAAAAAIATPQIRAMATLGGNLLQRNRCWYFRDPSVSCHKKGGAACPAREGNHVHGVCFDLGACVSPHPSTLGLALLAYEADFETRSGARGSIAVLYGNGADARNDHQLGATEVLTTVVMPSPVPGERAAYRRAITRKTAEWPLVEVLVRLAVAEGCIRFARVAAGGVAPVPLRRQEVEWALLNQPATRHTAAAAAARAATGARPLPGTGYKVGLLRATVLDALEHALG